MNYVRSIFGIDSKAERAMRTPFVASSWQVAKSGVFTIRADRICTRSALKQAQMRRLPQSLIAAGCCFGEDSSGYRYEFPSTKGRPYQGVVPLCSHHRGAVVRLLSHISFEEAATLPCAAVTLVESTCLAAACTLKIPPGFWPDTGAEPKIALSSTLTAAIMYKRAKCARFGSIEGWGE